MTMHRRRGLKAALLTLALTMGIGTWAQAQTQAQPYPVPGKPIKFVIGFPAGSSIDNVSRIVLEDIRERTGATIVIDNRPGALGILGVQAVAKAAADGYTLGPSSSATHSSGPSLSKAAARIDPVAEFTHIGRVVRFDVIVVTNAGPAHATAATLIADAKAQPGKLSYGYGSGTGQVAAAAFARAAGVELVGVPYKGQPPALTDLVGGRVSFVAADLGAVLPLVRSRQLTAVAVMSDKRSSILGNVPTVKELGLSGLNLTAWIGVAGPRELPADVVAWWQAQIKTSLASPAVAERLRQMAMEPDLLMGEPFQRFVEEQRTAWGKQIKDAGIEPE